MGLFNDKIDYQDYENSIFENNEQIKNDIVIADKTNYNYTFDSKTPIKSIINQLPGYIAKVTYFNKSTGNQQVYDYPDLSLDDLIIEYTKIDNLTLYMDSPIDSTNLKDYESEGYIKNVEPKPGDFILMPLYDKRLGLFVVTKTSAVTYNFTYLFKISFKFYMFPDKKDIEKINRNINKELVADDKLNNTGEEILYDKDRYTVIARIPNLIEKYYKIWENNIIKPENNYTISYLDDKLNHYVGDVYMERFIIDLIGVTNIKNVSLFNKRDDKLTILDLILDRDVSRWNLNKNYTVSYVYDKNNFPFLKEYMYNQIDYFVEVDNKHSDYYIFSKNFYEVLFTDNKDLELENYVELGIYSLIENIDIDMDTFNKIIDEIDTAIKNNNNKEIFYKIPLGIAILKYFKYKHNYPDKFIY